MAMQSFRPMQFFTSMLTARLWPGKMQMVQPSLLSNPPEVSTALEEDTFLRIE